MTECKPLVSVLVPVFNVEQYLDECIDSIESQTYGNIEVVFVNDGSTDDSPVILERRKRDNYIIINQKNRGLATARNTGIQHAMGDYVCFLDSDDVLPPTAIAQMVEVAEETGTDIVRGDCFRFSENAQWADATNYPSDRIELCKRHLGWTNYNNIWGGLYRRSLFTDNDLWFYDGLNFGEDFGMTTRLAYYARRVATVDALVYRYRVNPSSMTQVYKEKNAQDLFEISDRIKAFYESKPDYADYADAMMRGRARIKYITLLQLGPQLAAKYRHVFPELKEVKHLPVAERLKLLAMEHGWVTTYKIVNKIEGWLK